MVDIDVIHWNSALRPPRYYGKYGHPLMQPSFFGIGERINGFPLYIPLG